jgi:hypothetical protein
MAIKIIVEGKLPKPVVYVGRCDYCSCEVECDQMDLLEDTYNRIHCPTCKKLIDVTRDKYR